MASIFRASHRLLTAGCLLALLARASVAAVVYVKATTPGPAHDGLSWATAFQSVQQGVDAAQPGDEVWVAASTPAFPSYTENITLANRIALYGGFVGTETQRSQRDWRVHPTVLDAGGGHGDVVVCRSPNVVLDGFSISNGGNGVNVDSGNAVITNNTISGNGLNYGYGVYINTADAVVQNNIISNNAHANVFVDSGTASIARNVMSGSRAGAGVSAGTATLADNTIFGNDNGVVVYSGTAVLASNLIYLNGNNGIYMPSGTAIATSNTISANNGQGIRINAGTAVLSSNIVAFNTGIGVYVYERGGVPAGVVPVFSHNNVYGNGGGDDLNFTSPSSQGNIKEDPHFANRSAGDYRLLPGSPCVDAGDDSVIAAGQRDADGRLRIIDAHVDIGAFESGVTDTYTLTDALSALAVMGGLSTVTPSDFAHLNADRGGTSANRVDMYDTVWNVRRALGIDPA